MLGGCNVVPDASVGRLPGEEKNHGEINSGKKGLSEKHGGSQRRMHTCAWKLDLMKPSAYTRVWHVLLAEALQVEK